MDGPEEREIKISFGKEGGTKSSICFMDQCVERGHSKNEFDQVRNNLLGFLVFLKFLELLEISESL